MIEYNLNPSLFEKYLTSKLSARICLARDAINRIKNESKQTIREKKWFDEVARETMRFMDNLTKCIIKSKTYRQKADKDKAESLNLAVLNATKAEDIDKQIDSLVFDTAKDIYNSLSKIRRNYKYLPAVDFMVDPNHKKSPIIIVHFNIEGKIIFQIKLKLTYKTTAGFGLYYNYDGDGGAFFQLQMLKRDNFIEALMGHRLQYIKEKEFGKLSKNGKEDMEHAKFVFSTHYKNSSLVHSGVESSWLYI